MATLRSEFLCVHPATALWWQQREQCERCAHAHTVSGRDAETVMWCRAAPRPQKDWRVARLHEANGRQWMFCIDARGVNMPCGPAARLYQEAT